MINYDGGSGVSVGVSPLHSRTLVSQLTLHSINHNQAGNYSCSPSLVSVRAEQI